MPGMALARAADVARESPRSLQHPSCSLAPRSSGAPLDQSMLDTLTNRLSGVIKTLRGQARLTESNVQDALREVRMALLEADVALPVVKDFVAHVKERALGQEVVGSLTPGQARGGRGVRRAHRSDGRGQRAARPDHRSAGGDPDGRPAGLGQDHHQRQARAPAARGACARRCCW